MDEKNFIVPENNLESAEIIKMLNNTELNLDQKFVAANDKDFTEGMRKLGKELGLTNEQIFEKIKEIRDERPSIDKEIKKASDKGFSKWRIQLYLRLSGHDPSTFKEVILGAEHGLNMLQIRAYAKHGELSIDKIRALRAGIEYGFPTKDVKKVVYLSTLDMEKYSAMLGKIFMAKNNINFRAEQDVKIEIGMAILQGVSDAVIKKYALPNFDVDEMHMMRELLLESPGLYRFTLYPELLENPEVYNTTRYLLSKNVSLEQMHQVMQGPCGTEKLRAIATSLQKELYPEHDSLLDTAPYHPANSMSEEQKYEKQQEIINQYINPGPKEYMKLGLKYLRDEGSKKRCRNQKHSELEYTEERREAFDEDCR